VRLHGTHRLAVMARREARPRKTSIKAALRAALAAVTVAVFAADQPGVWVVAAKTGGLDAALAVAFGGME
jgi:CTP:molybdopterin cytidylyltransferase MocA